METQFYNLTHTDFLCTRLNEANFSFFLAQFFHVFEICGFLYREHFSSFFLYLNNVITFLDSQWFLVKSLMGFFFAILYSLNLREIASFFIHFLPKFLFSCCT